MNGFPYWQFHNDRWLSGKVSALDLDAQGLFLHFCMKAWSEQGSFNICSTSVKLRFRKTAEWVSETVAQMVDVGILVCDGQAYRIKFIDEQLESLHDVRCKRSKAGKASAAARAESNTNTKENTREEKSSVLKSVEQVFNTCSTHVELPLKVETLEEAFEVAWKEYPDKSGKTKALESYRKYRKEGDTQSDIQDGIERYKAYVAAKRSGGQDLGYQNGKTFFGNAGWRDEWVCDSMPPVSAGPKQAQGQSSVWALKESLTMLVNQAENDPYATPEKKRERSLEIQSLKKKIAGFYSQETA